jgi:hypothetical protein
VAESDYDWFQRNLAPAAAAAAVVPSQVARPWRATLRTVLQVGLPAFALLVGVLPEVLAAVLDGMGDTLPDGLRLWLLGAAAAVTALAGTLARIAAIPGVNRLLASVNLDAGAPAVFGRHAAGGYPGSASPSETVD